jgi:hypothetical protein
LSFTTARARAGSNRGSASAQTPFMVRQKEKVRNV